MTLFEVIKVNILQRLWSSEAAKGGVARSALFLRVNEPKKRVTSYEVTKVDNLYGDCEAAMLRWEEGRAAQRTDFTC